MAPGVFRMILASKAVEKLAAVRFGELCSHILGGERYGSPQKMNAAFYGGAPAPYNPNCPPPSFPTTSGNIPGSNDRPPDNQPENNPSSYVLPPPVPPNFGGNERSNEDSKSEDWRR